MSRSSWRLRVRVLSTIVRNGISKGIFNAGFETGLVPSRSSSRSSTPPSRQSSRARWLATNAVASGLPASSRAARSNNRERVRDRAGHERRGSHVLVAESQRLFLGRVEAPGKVVVDGTDGHGHRTAPPDEIESQLAALPVEPGDAVPFIAVHEFDQQRVSIRLERELLRDEVAQRDLRELRFQDNAERLVRIGADDARAEVESEARPVVARRGAARRWCASR